MVNEYMYRYSRWRFLQLALHMVQRDNGFLGLKTIMRVSAACWLVCIALLYMEREPLAMALLATVCIAFAGKFVAYGVGSYASKVAMRHLMRIVAEGHLSLDETVARQRELDNQILESMGWKDKIYITYGDEDDA